MSILDKQTTTQLQSGLHKDYTFKPASYTTFVLNGIRDSHTGGKYQYQSEPGNELVDTLPEGNTICGWIYGQNNEIYLFSSHAEYSEIGIFRDGIYNTTLQADLGFDPAHPITGEYRLKNGCERVIYWCDGENPDYYYNFDRDEIFKDDANLYDPNLFRLVPKILPPKIDLDSVNDSGGLLPLGSYYFQVEILDDALNSIYKSDITPQVIIYDDSIADVYTLIDGGLNIAQFSEEVGGVPITSKSITLTIYNLDTSFAYIRMNVIRQLTANQVVDAHAVGSLIPISSESIQWTYTGYDVSKGDFPVDYSETLVENAAFETSYVMEQVQNRLIRGFVTEDLNDYATYQRFASKIQTHWIAEEVEIEQNVTPGCAKNPDTYWMKTSFQGDEVVAFGIQYLSSSGKWSPSFHIPGRSATSSDEEPLVVFLNNTAGPLGANQVWESDVEHIPSTEFEIWAGDYFSSIIKKWKVFNTGYITDVDSSAHPYTFKGLMGYYECDETYPELRDCDGNLIWGEDYEGNEITESTKIRHHRFPDRRTIPHYNGDYIIPLGVQFSNIEYPDANIIGHRFCYVKRSEGTKTVLDSGWFVKAFDDVSVTFDLSVGTTQTGVNSSSYLYSVASGSGDPGQIEGRHGVYISFDVLSQNKLYSQANHLRINTAYGFDQILEEGFQYFPRTGGDEIETAVFKTPFNQLGVPERTNYKIEKQVMLQPSSYIDGTDFNKAVLNDDFLSSRSVIRTAYEIENIFNTITSGAINGFYTYKKSYIKPYGDLFTLNYSYLHMNYVSTSDLATNSFYGGDTLITKSNYLVNFTLATLDDGSVYYNQLHNNLYEERQINSELRYAGTLDASKYYKDNDNFKQMLFKAFTLQDDGSFDLKLIEDRLPESYAYNMDYDKQLLQQSKVPLPITYNYCKDCIGEYANRIVFSPKSFDEEIFDLYRINKVNDYIDLPGHRGAITGLKYKGNLLLAHCKEGTFILQPNPQALTTNLADVYLSTGDFLGIPPAELMQTDIGYAGCQSKQHQCDTPNGWCWTDQLRGQIFKFDNKLQELSNQGMVQWFNEHLPSELQYAFYQIFQTEYSTPSTLSIEGNGIGLIMFYDPKYNRLIISKKDFLPINFSDRAVSIGDVSYDFGNNVWVGVNNLGETVTVYFDNSLFFENKSWTLSYSFDYEGQDGNPWTSWHSYIPPFAFWDNFHFYTLPVPSEGFKVRSIYRHKHHGSFQTFYGDKKDFIIEWMDYSPETRDFNAIHYNGYTLEWDDTTQQWLQNNTITFDRGMFYTFNQSTGLVDLSLVNQHTNPYAHVGFSNGVKTIIRTDNNFKISGLYDLAIDVPVITSEWTSLQDNYYIDLVPNESNIDYLKPQFELNNLKDKFIITRLYFRPVDDYKKIINLLQNQNSISIR